MYRVNGEVSIYQNLIDYAIIWEWFIRLTLYVKYYIISYIISSKIVYEVSKMIRKHNRIWINKVTRYCAISKNIISYLFQKRNLIYETLHRLAYEEF